jgi:signal transduction histidine kinase
MSVETMHREQRLEIRALLERVEKLEYALEASRIGTWEWNPRSLELRLDARCRAMFDLPTSTHLSLDGFISGVCPKQRDAVLGAIRDALTARERGSFEVEYQSSANALGESRWYLARGRVKFDDGGRALWVVGTVSDESEHKRAEEEHELFLGVLGHDLRNPLNAIQMSAAKLLRSPDTPLAHTRFLLRILGSSERMGRLIRDLVAFAKQRLSGGLPVVLERIDLGPLLEEMEAEFAAAYPDRALEFVRRGDLVGCFDGDRMAQVIQNLVGNALQHGQADAPVKLLAEEAEPGWIVIQVHNSGAPISAEQLEKIFEPLQPQPAGSMPRSLGLGLFIVRAIVQAHRGEVEATSDENGTTFSVRIPKQRPHTIASAIRRI